MNELEKIKVIRELNKLDLHELQVYISVCKAVDVKTMAIHLYNSKIKSKKSLETEQKIQYYKNLINKHC